MQADFIKQLIESAFPDAQVAVHGDDGVHFEAMVVSEAFVGKPLPQQHRLVYGALGGRLESGEIHALALRTYTPESWAKQQAQS